MGAASLGELRAILACYERLPWARMHALEALNSMRRACSADSRHDSCAADLALLARFVDCCEREAPRFARPIDGRTCRPSLVVDAEPPACVQLDYVRRDPHVPDAPCEKLENLGGATFTGGDVLGPS